MWASDPRRFRASEGQLRQTPDLAAELAPGVRGPSQWLTREPCDRQAAALLASDPHGLLTAEHHARASIRALLEFGVVDQPRRIAWRIAGCAVERPESGEPPLVQLRAPIRLAGDLMQRLTGRPLDPPHPHLRFRLAHALLTWSHRRARALDLVVPAEFGRLAGRRLGELDDPFEPWLRLLETGTWLWALTDSTIELAAPFPVPSGPRPDKRGRADIARVSRPSALWSERLSELRLACMRGEPAWVERMRIRVAETREPGRAPMVHFGVYGGPAVLDMLAAHEPEFEVDELDDQGRTALMLAAGLPRRGPTGAHARELEVPIGASLGPASIVWLLARGARLDARDLLGRTALHWAAHAGRSAAVAALIAQGAELEARDSFGRTPLALALSDDLVELPFIAMREVVEGLLAAGADADTRDEFGWTPLHYLAASQQPERRGLAGQLRRAGAQPSRDRMNRTPADLLTTRDSNDPAFDPRTPVAAGPGAWPERIRCPDLERALTLDPETTGRAPNDTLAVWADWLQSQADSRGELLAAELCTRALGRKRRRVSGVELERVNSRLQATRDRGQRLADPGSMLGNPRIEVRRVHGMMIRARVVARPGALAEARRAVAALLDREPLLTDLRLGCSEPERWPEFLASLTTLSPATQVRRVVLGDLPAEAPVIDRLASVFPRACELRLIGRGKLDALRLDWPAIETLQIRHGDSSEWTRGGSAFELAPGQLHSLDLGLPIGGQTRPEQLLGFQALLESLGPELRRLRLAPVAPDFLARLLATTGCRDLHTLVLDRVRGRALELLVDQLARSPTSRFDRLERFELSVARSLLEQRSVELDALRRRLPALALTIR